MVKKVPEEQTEKAQIIRSMDEPVIWSGWMAPNTMAEKPVRCMTESMLMPLVVEAAAQQAIATVIKAATAAETVIAVMAEPGRLELKEKMETMPLSMAVAVEPVVAVVAEAVEVLLPVLTEMSIPLVLVELPVHSVKAAMVKPDA
jgi:hypothetical protein